MFTALRRESNDDLPVYSHGQGISYLLYRGSDDHLRGNTGRCVHWRICSLHLLEDWPLRPLEDGSLRLVVDCRGRQ